MEDYLNKLERMIESKNLQQFCVFPDVKPFKIIKKYGEEVEKMILKNPKKYAGRKLAIVFLNTNKRGFKEKKHIFSIGVSIYKIYNDGSIDQVPSDNWGFSLNYMPEDLEKHPFKMSNIEKIVKLVDKKYLTSEFLGISYDRFEDKLNYIKEKYGKKKEANRTSKITSKRTSKKSSKRTLKKISKKSSKKYIKKSRK